MNEDILGAYIQLLKQLNNKHQVGLVVYIMYQGAIQGGVPMENFSLFTFLAYQRYPKYIDKLLKRLVGMSVSELVDEGHAIMARLSSQSHAPS